MKLLHKLLLFLKSGRLRCAGEVVVYCFPDNAKDATHRHEHTATLSQQKLAGDGGGLRIKTTNFKSGR